MLTFCKTSFTISHMPKEAVGCVTHLFIKPQHKVPMAACQEIEVKTALGIDGDINAQSMSPRQILMVRQEDLDELGVVPGNIRENMAISGFSSDAFVSGSLLCIGQSAKIRTTFLCEACKRINDVVPSLKSIADKRGLLGVIIANGVIQLGDEVSVLPNQFPVMSDVPYYRFLEYVAKIPQGRVVTYREVVIGIGVAESFMRAIPTYIKRTSQDEYPLHRIVDTEGKIIPYVTGQLELLMAEGIQCSTSPTLFDDSSKARISLLEYLWNEPSLYLS